MAGNKTAVFFRRTVPFLDKILRNIVEASVEKFGRYLGEFVSFTKKLLWCLR